MQPRTYSIDEIRDMRNQSLSNANGEPTAQAPTTLSDSAPQAPQPKSAPVEKVEGLCHQIMAFMSNHYRQINLISAITMSITLMVIASRLKK